MPRMQMRVVVLGLVFVLLGGCGHKEESQTSPPPDEAAASALGTNIPVTDESASSTEARLAVIETSVRGSEESAQPALSRLLALQRSRPWNGLSEAEAARLNRLVVTLVHKAHGSGDQSRELLELLRSLLSSELEVRAKVEAALGVLIAEILSTPLQSYLWALAPEWLGVINRSFLRFERLSVTERVAEVSQLGHELEHSSDPTLTPSLIAEIKRAIFSLWFEDDEPQSLKVLAACAMATNDVICWHGLIFGVDQ